MTQATYSVELRDNLVIAKISGDWDLQADIGYLTLLDEAISKVRSDKWAIFADLRGWRVSDEVANLKHNVTIQIARNNQCAECWLVDNIDQGKHIQHHVVRAGVPFAKCLSKQKAANWLFQNGFYLPQNQ